MSFLGAPTNIVLQTGNGQNFLTWSQVSGATGYSIQRGTDGVNWLNTYSPSGVVASYLDATALIGVNYFYQVATINGSGTGAYSASAPVNITPCLPGQINLGYLRYQSQLRADKAKSRYLTMDEWNININSSKDELYDILTTKFGDDYFMAPPLIISLTGAQYYPLPDGSNYPINGKNSPAIFKLNGVDANINGASTGPNAGWIPLSRANWSDRDKYTTWPAQAGALNNIYQMSYREMGQNVFIFPQNTNMVIQLWYVPIPVQLLQDTDMLVFGFTSWWEYIINDAAKKAMIKEESLDKWNALDNANNVIRSRIETTSANRDVGQPNTVSNTRATMGDPGFSGWGGGFGSGGMGGSGGF